MGGLNPLVCNINILDTLSEANVKDITESYSRFCSATDSILEGDLSCGTTLSSSTHVLSGYGLRSLLQDHFLNSLEERFEKCGVHEFWKCLECLRDAASDGNDKIPVCEEVESVLCKALEGISKLKDHHEKCLSLFINALESWMQLCSSERKDNLFSVHKYLFSRYQLLVSSVLMAGLPRHFPEILHWYFIGRLEKISSFADGDRCVELTGGDEMHSVSSTRTSYTDRCMNIDSTSSLGEVTSENTMVKQIGLVVQKLRSLGLSSMTESAYGSAIFSLLKAKVYELAGDDYRVSVLKSVQQWIQAVPLKFLQALLSYLGDSVSSCGDSASVSSPFVCQPSCGSGSNISSEGTVRWKLRLDYFAYETLQDLRIAKLFDIIVDYPDSAPAIEDLKQCLEHTGQHSKLVESFISSLKFRLLTAGASTNDILHQYVSTIKALRTIDPAGIFLEAVGEPIRDYLRGRKDTIKCIVTMLTDGSGGNPNASGMAGDSLLEELNRDEENQETVGDDEDFHGDDKQAWLNALRWEPDPAEADPMKGSRNRRKVDILGIMVGVIGSKDQLVNEYRVMLAEKLLNKSDYDIDTEIRTLELLKIHFGESNMQRCEIMLNDMIDSKRTNHNIQATQKHSQTETRLQENGHSLDNISATIISTNFWPPIQDETLTLPVPIEDLLTDYAQKYHEIKTPRKLLWKKSLGAVKLELQFEDRVVEFTVTPTHAAIIMQFQDQTSWSSTDLAAAVGLPVDILNRRITFWISKGIIVESNGRDSADHIFSLAAAKSTKNSDSDNMEELLGGDEEEDMALASGEDQILKEMTVFEKFILGMLTNFGGMALDRIHNTLKIFCVADPPYDKSIQQLQTFLSGLVTEEKLELRDGIYLLRK